MMRRTKEDAELTRQAVLEAAITEFSRSGYAATRLEDIAKTANVTRGAVYHHFSGGKAELFAHIIDQATQTGTQAIDRAIQEGGPFLDILHRILVFLNRLSDYLFVLARYCNHLSGQGDLLWGT